MKLHPRYSQVASAETDVTGVVLDALKRHPDLTYLELLRIMNNVMATWLKYALREERHPDDPDKRGDEE
jgi:hypothetical protein